MAHQVKCGVYTGHMCDCMMDWSEALSVLRSYADDRKISADYVNSLEAAVRDEQTRLVATIKRYKEQLSTYADITERLQTANAEMGDVLNAARERESAMRAQIKRLNNHLHRISLASQNSMSSQHECGVIAREALEE